MAAVVVVVAFVVRQNFASVLVQWPVALRRQTMSSVAMTWCVAMRRHHPSVVARRHRFDAMSDDARDDAAMAAVASGLVAPVASGRVASETDRATNVWTMRHSSVAMHS